MKKTTVTCVFLSLTLVCSDIAIAAEASASVAAAGEEAANAQSSSPRGEIRRPSRALCAGVGLVVGLLAGALLGRSRRSGGDGFSDSAAVVGGVGAALICGAIRWRSVAREDQDDVNRRVAAMTLDPNATTQTYRSSITGKTYTITPSQTSYRNANNEFTTATEVDAPQRDYKVTSTPFRVDTAVLNLRGTPGSETSDRITGAFYRNDFVQSFAESPDGQWVLVGFDNVGYGWVSRRYLLPATISYDRITFARPGPPATPEVIAAANAPPPAPVRAAPRRGRGRARARAPATPTGPIFVARRMAALPQVHTQRVRVQMPCRQYSVAEAGVSDRHRACQGSHGMAQLG
jgi:hypothetical protein